MHRSSLWILAIVGLIVVFPLGLCAKTIELRNETMVVSFGSSGPELIRNMKTGAAVHVTANKWSLAIDNDTLESESTRPKIRSASADEIVYEYELSGYKVEATYRLAAGWEFVSQVLKVVESPKPFFTVHRVMPLQMAISDQVISSYTPSTYVPQFGASIEASKRFLPGRDFGIFLRLPADRGAMLLVQNPYLEITKDKGMISLGYAPEMQWNQTWGEFSSDVACIGPYLLSGERLPREMVSEWNLPPTLFGNDGMDRAEIDAFTKCVRAFLVHPSPSPTSVEVGWTLNDYQIDVATREGQEEYKRIIDTASALGIRTLLYAPENSLLAKRSESTDTWSWEYVLWLGLGEKIRKGEWDPEKDPVPEDVKSMISYAKSKGIGLLAYVYPSVPFAQKSSWLVKGKGEEAHVEYATLASRDFQDYLIRNLVAFLRRTGIAGYSFDYTWLNLPGSSSYAQWFGWQRVMEALRDAAPEVVIDGRQSYQLYGPWSWLAGSYPHPTGNDEQPESFTPFPDLHFDRVSADRTRFVNYWYRNYQFAPEELIPGYATHQTERSRNVIEKDKDGKDSTRVEMMYSRYRPRDWDYLGYKYSFLSSIATGGWNNVVDMIPARDIEEWKHFSEDDKTWIRDWLKWTVANKAILRKTRTILGQPAIGHVDGTAAILSDHGFIFLFNPNYKKLTADFSLNKTIGLDQGEDFLLREIYPRKGMILGKSGAGIWKRGDSIHLPLDGTSATVFELLPAEEHSIVVVNAAMKDDASANRPNGIFTAGTLSISHAAGEPGSTKEIGALLPSNDRVKRMIVNGKEVTFTQNGRYAYASIHFAGREFSHSQEIALKPGSDGSWKGSFVVPQRVLDQLAVRAKRYPISWTPEDYETTWLVPERLLLFVQFAEPKDSMKLSATLDGRPLTLTPAYSSTRKHAPSFVGFYADLSRIPPNVSHEFSLSLPELNPGQFQGVFFDNVEPQYTEELVP